MKILHTSDIHLGELSGPIINGENARMMDTVRCMNFIVTKALEEDIDLIVIPGDLFNKSKLWADEMLKEITIAAGWLRSLCSIAPTVLMWGTGNHDNLAAFENIRKMDIDNLTVVTEPNLLNIYTKAGWIQVATVPGMDKGFFRELYPGMDMEDENKAISEALGNVILGISANADKDLPLILMSHYTVMGSTTGNGEALFMNSDIVIPTEALQASNYDLVCLGHIHKAQSIPNCGRPVYYSGPPNAISFNEEGQRKGFYVHDFDEPSMQLNSKFINTPSREFLTLRWDENDVQHFNIQEITEEVEEKIVRVIYSCSDEINKKFSRKSLEKALYAAGAFYVSEIKPEKILTTTDKNAMNENDTVEDNLRLWLEKQEVSESDIKEILELSRPMISQVSASLPTGKLSGVFEPLRLEVKNYRSYKEEQFDFTKVNFATVNGPNGIGKSSFFMDAIADCLYEEPREGELTGWISNGDDIKSGAMTFEFLMGSDKWRVIRTRVKSGKTTLALQRFIETEWKDFSEDNKTQTQEKILNLLGMDALTFKSCALIMQDNYGVFLEADKADRMQVLGNILGLGIYDKLTDLAKTQLKIQNKKVDTLKNEIAALDEKLKEKPVIEESLKNNNFEKVMMLESILKEEDQLKELKTQLEKLKDIQSKIKVLTDKITSISADIEIRETEKIKLTADKEKAQKVVDKEETILLKIREYETTRDKITMLKARQALVNNKQSDVVSVSSDINKNKADAVNNDRKINILQVELKDKEVLELAIKSLDALEKDLIVMDKDEVLLKELIDKKYKTEKDISRARNKEVTESNAITVDIFSCEKKAKLISDSNCPIVDPSCNFLKDALEAKNNIPLLQDKLSKVDKSESLKLAEELIELTKESIKIKESYDHYDHGKLKAKVSDLKKKKEQLINLSGKDEVLKNLLEQQAELSKKLESLEAKLVILQDELEILQVEVAELPSLEERMPMLEHWYKGKDELPIAKQLLATTNERLEVLEKEISSRGKERTLLAIDGHVLREERDLITIRESAVSEKETQIKNSKNELTNIEILIGVDLSKLDELISIEAQKEVKATELAVAASITVKANLLTKAFAIDGIPFQIVRSVIPELSNQANEILSQMTGGKMSIEMRMDKSLKSGKEINVLEIWISDYQRGTMPYLSRSGGQKVKVSLAVAFSLADLKANRVGIRLSMMFIDECPFLDGEGVQAYCDALETIHESYPEMRILSISHDPAFKARFPQLIEVIDTGDQGSKIIFNG